MARKEGQQFGRETLRRRLARRGRTWLNTVGALGAIAPGVLNLTHSPSAFAAETPVHGGQSVAATRIDAQSSQALPGTREAKIGPNTTFWSLAQNSLPDGTLLHVVKIVSKLDTGYANIDSTAEPTSLVPDSKIPVANRRTAKFAEDLATKKLPADAPQEAKIVQGELRKLGNVDQDTPEAEITADVTVATAMTELVRNGGEQTVFHEKKPRKTPTDDLTHQAQSPFPHGSQSENAIQATQAPEHATPQAGTSAWGKIEQFFGEKNSLILPGALTGLGLAAITGETFVLRRRIKDERETVDLKIFSGERIGRLVEGDDPALKDMIVKGQQEGDITVFAYAKNEYHGGWQQKLRSSIIDPWSEELVSEGKEGKVADANKFLGTIISNLAERTTNWEKRGANVQIATAWVTITEQAGAKLLALMEATQSRDPQEFASDWVTNLRTAVTQIIEVNNGAVGNDETKKNVDLVLNEIIDYPEPYVVTSPDQVHIEEQKLIAV